MLSTRGQAGVNLHTALTVLGRPRYRLRHERRVALAHIAASSGSMDLQRPLLRPPNVMRPATALLCYVITSPAASSFEGDPRGGLRRRQQRFHLERRVQEYVGASLRSNAQQSSQHFAKNLKSGRDRLTDARAVFINPKPKILNLKP